MKIYSENLKLGKKVRHNVSMEIRYEDKLV